MTEMLEVLVPREQRADSVTAREIRNKASKGIEASITKAPNAQAQMIQVMGTSTPTCDPTPVLNLFWRRPLKFAGWLWPRIIRTHRSQ